MIAIGLNASMYVCLCLPTYLSLHQSVFICIPKHSSVCAYLHTYLTYIPILPTYLSYLGNVSLSFSLAYFYSSTFG